MSGKHGTQASTQAMISDWEPRPGINKEGKHILAFPRELPLLVFGSRCPYHLNHYPNHHDYCEISVNCGGAGLFHVGDRVYEFQRGDIAILGSDVVHGLQAMGEEPLDLLHLFFLPAAAFQAPGTDESCDLIRPFIECSHPILKAEELNHMAVLRCILRMHRLLRDKPRFHQLLVRQQMLDLLIFILKHCDSHGLLGGGAGARVPLRRGKMHRLGAVFELVARGFQRQIPLEEAAAAANMSRAYFCRFFRAITGSTFTEYVNRYRVGQAKQMILRQELTLSQVAYRVGFNNEGYFFRVFRKYARLSPREFVAEHTGARKRRERLTPLIDP
jgi:AraC-like DNA-binding protein/mannose-6-phosphate isomerase-like protein (cupin superfamily)